MVQCSDSKYAVPPDNSNKLERCTAYDIDHRYCFITIFDYMPKEWK